MTQNYNQTLSALLLILRDYWLLCIAFAIFMIVVKWKILNKAGQGGWKQFIPIYNVYLEYKLYWNTSYFWILLLSPFMLYYISTMASSNVSAIAGLIALLIIGVILFSPIVLQFKKAKSFGQSFWFGVGLLLLNPIFQIALAFDEKCIYRYYDGYTFTNYNTHKETKYSNNINKHRNINNDTPKKNRTWYERQMEELDKETIKYENDTVTVERKDETNKEDINEEIKDERTSGYESSKSIATKTEKAFYKVLKQYCDERGYTINLKTRLEDLVEYAKGMDYATKQKYRGQIKSRHVDYLIVDDDLNPVFAIELDDSSHNKKKAQEIDKFKNDLFDKIGIKLYRIPADEFLWKLELEKLFINVDEERM